MSTEVLEQTDRLVMKRTYQTSLDAMWAAWTEPEHLEKWFGCSETGQVEARIDLKTGGELHVDMGHKEGGTMTLEGRYTEVTPKTRLGFTWEWKGDTPMQFGPTDVLIELKEVGAAVELTLTHSGFPNEEVTGMHQGGWSDGLDKLEKHLAG